MNFDNVIIPACNEQVICGENQFKKDGECVDCFTPVVSLAANRATINLGESVTLAFGSTVPDIDSSVVTIEYGDTVTPVTRNETGTIAVSPVDDTTYTIRAVTECGEITAMVSVVVDELQPCLCPGGFPDCLQLDVVTPTQVFNDCGYKITTDEAGAIPWDGTLPKIRDCKWGYESDTWLYILAVGQAAKTQKSKISAVVELISCDPYTYRLTFALNTDTHFTVRAAGAYTTDIYPGAFFGGVTLAFNDRILFFSNPIFSDYGGVDPERRTGIFVNLGNGGVPAVDADTYAEITDTPVVLVTDGDHAGQYLQIDQSNSDLDMAVDYFPLENLWQGESVGLPFGPFVSVNHGTSVGCNADTDYSLKTCNTCVDPEVRFDPPSGSSVSFPTVVFLHSTNESDSIYYGINEDAIHLYDGGPINLSAGQTLTARSVTILGCQSEIVTADYDQDDGLSFALICDGANDKVGVFDEFESNGNTNDYHWRIMLTRALAWTLRGITIYETNNEGVWVTGQAWSTKNPINPIEIDPDDFTVYPTVVFNGATQLNSAYADNLDIDYPSGDQVLNAYGQPFVPLTGYFRLELTIDEGGSPFTIYKLIPHSCADCGTVAKPSVQALCDGTIHLAGIVPVNAQYRVLVATLPDCGSGVHFEEVTAFSIDGGVVFVKNAANNCSYSLVLSVFCALTNSWIDSPPATITVPDVCPVDCVLSDWSDWQVYTDWDTCEDGEQQRVEYRTREVVTPASNGGAPCGPLFETRLLERPCGDCFESLDVASSIVAENPIATGTINSCSMTLNGAGSGYSSYPLTCDDRRYDVAANLCSNNEGIGWIFTVTVPSTGEVQWVGGLAGTSPFGSYTQIGTATVGLDGQNAVLGPFED